MPRVSICLPNLNTRPFLEERMQSILAQTFRDWELIICDAFSDDGSWEYLKRFGDDPRCWLFQAPRQGVYAGINECLCRARGDYVYIATSDDTMTPDCLEKLVAALDAHPECGLAHCCLTAIDERSRPIEGWWERMHGVAFYGDLIRQAHLRKAPRDALLYCGLYTVYLSLTQLLIRRSLFDRTGLFPTRYGAEGDFQWGFKAAFLTDTIHIPEHLATWRRRAGQATREEQDLGQRCGRYCRMIEEALPELRRINAGRFGAIDWQIALKYYRMEQLLSLMRTAPHRRARIGRLLRFLGLRPDVVGWYLVGRCRGSMATLPPRYEFMTELLKQFALQGTVELFDGAFVNTCCASSVRQLP